MSSIGSDSSSHNDLEKTSVDVSQRPPVDLDEQEKQEPRRQLAPSDEDPYLVFLDSNESPKNWSLLRKCIVVFVVSTGALCSTFASSIVSMFPCSRTWCHANARLQAAFAEPGEAETFHVGREIPILGVSLYVLGIGTSSHRDTMSVNSRFAAPSLWSAICRAFI